MDLKGSTLPFPMGLPLQNQEADLVHSRWNLGPIREALSQLRGSASLSQVIENRQGLCAVGPQMLRGPCLGSLEVASLGVLKLERKKDQEHFGGQTLTEGRMGRRKGRGRRDRLQPETCVCEGAGGMKDGGGL